MPLNNLFCALVETGVNKLHQLDTSAIQKRKQLQGTIIGVALKEVNFPLYFIISWQQLDVVSTFAGEPDCFIQVSLSALNQLQDKQKLTSLIKSGELEVEGDIELVQQFAALMTDLDIDWEEHLSSKVGDVLAHKLSYHFQRAKQQANKQFKQLKNQSALYITEEIKLAPSALEVAHFCDQVSRLDEQSQQLEQKLAHLTNKLLG